MGAGGAAVLWFSDLENHQHFFYNKFGHLALYLGLSHSLSGQRVGEVRHLGEHLLGWHGTELVIVTRLALHLRLVGGGVHGLLE